MLRLLEVKAYTFPCIQKQQHWKSAVQVEETSEGFNDVPKSPCHNLGSQNPRKKKEALKACFWCCAKRRWSWDLRFVSFGIRIFDSSGRLTEDSLDEAKGMLSIGLSRCVAQQKGEDSPLITMIWHLSRFTSHSFWLEKLFGFREDSVSNW